MGEQFLRKKAARFKHRYEKNRLVLFRTPSIFSGSAWDRVTKGIRVDPTDSERPDIGSSIHICRRGEIAEVTSNNKRIGCVATEDLPAVQELLGQASVIPCEVTRHAAVGSSFTVTITQEEDETNERPAA